MLLQDSLRVAGELFPRLFKIPPRSCSPDSLSGFRVSPCSRNWFLVYLLRGRRRWPCLDSGLGCGRQNFCPSSLSSRFRLFVGLLYDESFSFQVMRDAHSKHWLASFPSCTKSDLQLSWRGDVPRWAHRGVPGPTVLVRRQGVPRPAGRRHALRNLLLEPGRRHLRRLDRDLGRCHPRVPLGALPRLVRYCCCFWTSRPSFLGLCFRRADLRQSVSRPTSRENGVKVELHVGTDFP